MVLDGEDHAGKGLCVVRHRLGVEEAGDVLAAVADENQADIRTD